MDQNYNPDLSLYIELKDSADGLDRVRHLARSTAPRSEIEKAAELAHAQARKSLIEWAYSQEVQEVKRHNRKAWFLQVTIGLVLFAIAVAVVTAIVVRAEAANKPAQLPDLPALSTATVHTGIEPGQIVLLSYDK